MAEEEALKRVRVLGLHAAPEVVRRVEIQPGEGALITRYPSCMTGQLVPVSPGAVSISPAARALFRDEMRKLGEHRLVHAYAPRGYDCWLIASDSGTLVLDRWGVALRDCSAGEVDEAMRRIDRLLQRASS